MALIENYITFSEGVPKLLRFADYQVMDKQINDPTTKNTRPVKSLHMTVTEEDGRPVQKELSILSEKFAALLEPYILGGSYKAKLFKVTRTGSGFNTNYSVEVL